MSISFFEDSNRKASTNLPFVEAYVEVNPPPYEPDTIISVSRTRKRTGYMLHTAKYSIFLFEGSQMLNQLLEALNQWVLTGEGYHLVAVPEESDPYYKLGTDFEKPCRWIHTQGKYTWFALTGSISEAAPTVNSFLPPTQKTRTTRHK